MGAAASGVRGDLKGGYRCETNIMGVEKNLTNIFVLFLSDFRKDNNLP